MLTRKRIIIIDSIKLNIEKLTCDRTKSIRVTIVTRMLNYYTKPNYSVGANLSIKLMP